MTTPATNPNPATGGELLAGYDPVGHQTNVLISTKNVQTDATTGLIYGDLAIDIDTVALFTQASGATTGTTQNSGDLDVTKFLSVTIDINTTAQSGTNPTIQYFWERKGADGIYYVLWQSAVLTAAANTLSTSVGPGLAYNQSLGLTGRLRWAVGGTATPTFTHSLNVYAKTA